MTENTDTTEATTSIAAELATERGALQLHELQLVGLVGTPQDRRALLRRASGQIDMVRVGDTVRQGTVVAIDDEVVVLNAASGSRTLRFPKHPPAPRVAA